jgi:hypothetical protein
MLNMYRLLLLVIALFASAGMCDEFIPPEEQDSDGDASVECAENMCQDLITVQIIRADNMGFQPGVYEFSVTLSDQSTFEISCDLGYGEAGFACNMGDTTYIIAQLGTFGEMIWLNLLFASEQVTVAVYYNGFEIGQRLIVPFYDDTTLGTDDCPLYCSQAEASMAVESW